MILNCVVDNRLLMVNYHVLKARSLVLANKCEIRGFEIRNFHTSEMGMSMDN